MDKSFRQRTELLLGEEAVWEIAKKRVILFGVGGVGGWCAESLVRSGIEHLTLVDFDTVAPSNLNRQITALQSTIGEVKVDVLRERLLQINPQAEITAIHKLYNEQTKSEFNLDEYDYVIDCIDSLKDKILLIVEATRSRATLFSSMGSALKIDPTKIRVAEFWKVSGCPFGSIIRKRMRQQKLMPSKKFLCVYSSEVLENKGNTPTDELENQPAGLPRKAQINGTMAHVTAIFGFTIAGLVVKDIVEKM